MEQECHRAQSAEKAGLDAGESLTRESNEVHEVIKCMGNTNIKIRAQ
jgi:hypothetical protein